MLMMPEMLMMMPEMQMMMPEMMRTMMLSECMQWTNNLHIPSPTLITLVYVCVAYALKFDLRTCVMLESAAKAVLKEHDPSYLTHYYH